MCPTSVYTPVSRPQYSVLQVSIPQLISVKGLCARAMRAQVRTSVQQRDDGSTLRWVPFRGSFAFQQQRLSILLFHQHAAGEAYVSKLQQKVLSGDQVSTSIQQKSRDNTPDITEHKDLVSQNTGPFKQDFGGYPYIQEQLPTNQASLNQVYISFQFTKCAKILLTHPR